jgi:hypothetical protein
MLLFFDSSTSLNLILVNTEISNRTILNQAGRK